MRYGERLYKERLYRVGLYGESLCGERLYREGLYGERLCRERLYGERIYGEGLTRASAPVTTRRALGGDGQVAVRGCDGPADAR